MAGVWVFRELGNAVGREKRGMVVGGARSERSVMTARVVGGMMRERRTTLMSRCQVLVREALLR